MNGFAPKIRYLQSTLVSPAPLRPSMYHVYAHQDRNLCFDQLDVHEQTNVCVDNMAIDEPIVSISVGRFITGGIPFDDVRLRVGAKRVSGSPTTTKAIHNFWGASGARKFLHKKGTVYLRDFNLIYWDGMEEAMEGFPDMFRTWVTKTVSHFCGMNRQLSKIDKTVKNICRS